MRSARFLVQMTIIFCWLFLAGACATGTLQLSSIPDAGTVSLLSSRGEIKNLGTTPLTIEMPQLFSSGSAFAFIRVDKEGYFSQSFIIPRNSLPTVHQISTNLEAKPEIKPPESEKPAPTPESPVAIDLEKCTSLSKDGMTKLGKGIAIVQSLILKRDWEVAKVRLAGLLSEFNYISVLYDLQGNIYYLQKNYAEALGSYEKSMELDPENIDTTIMVRRLRAQLGRSP